MKNMKRTVFANTVEIKSKKFREYYGVVDFQDKPSRLITYETNVRNEAVDYFKKVARQLGGTLNTVSSFR